MTQQTGKLRVLNVKVESEVFGTVITYLCQQKRGKGYHRLTAIRDSSKTEQENDVTPLSSDCCLFTTLHFVMGKTCSKYRGGCKALKATIPSLR